MNRRGKRERPWRGVLVVAMGSLPNPRALRQLSLESEPWRADLRSRELPSLPPWSERLPALRDWLLALEDELPMLMLPRPILPPSMPCFWPVVARSAEPFF